MTLDIIIPQYTESERIIAKLLYSISIQRHISFGDINVTIVNDCSDVEISDAFLAKYPYAVSKMRTDSNVGCGLARQMAFDATSADYVMFCDADDAFCSTDALRLILDSTATLPDVITGGVIQESATGKCYSLPAISTMVHGKAFRRKFLIGEGIRFRNDLRTNEDVYFVGLACTIASHTAVIPEKIYAYLWNASSITRRNSYAYLIDEYGECIRASLLLLDELRLRGAAHTKVKESLVEGCASIISYAASDRRAELCKLTEPLIIY